jgi:hypothetical protein
VKIRGDVSFRVLLVGLLCASTVACGNSSKAKAKPDAAAGHDGGDAAGLDDAAADGRAGDAVDATDATSSDGDGDTDASADAASGDATDAPSGDVVAAIDAGVGCMPPADDTALSAAAEGLPADGLVLWVRGDRGVYKMADDTVCGWRDQVSSSRLLHASTSRPTWQGASVGGQAAIHFNVVGDDLYTDPLGILATSARTFIAVSQLASATGRFHPILQGQGNSAGTYIGIDANTWQTVGSREGVYVTNNSYDSATTTITTAPRIHVLTLSTLALGTAVMTALDYRIDGATQTLTLKAGDGTIADFSAADFTTVGAVSGTPSAGVTTGDGFVAEALIYNRALTLVERAAVEAVLKARYGIQ